MVPRRAVSERFQRLSRTNSRRDFQAAAGPTHRKPDNALITATGDFALAAWCALFRWREGHEKLFACRRCDEGVVRRGWLLPACCGREGWLREERPVSGQSCPRGASQNRYPDTRHKQRRLSKCDNNTGRFMILQKQAAMNRCCQT